MEKHSDPRFLLPEPISQLLEWYNNNTEDINNNNDKEKPYLLGY